MNDTPQPVVVTLPAECCMTCRFYRFEEKLCRRYPPNIIVLERKKGGEVKYASKFPPMNPNGWCGEHQEAQK